jgi:hypothetical protein
LAARSTVVTGTTTPLPSGNAAGLPTRSIAHRSSAVIRRFGAAGEAPGPGVGRAAAGAAAGEPAGGAAGGAERMSNLLKGDGQNAVHEASILAKSEARRRAERWLGDGAAGGGAPARRRVRSAGPLAGPGRIM